MKSLVELTQSPSALFDARIGEILEHMADDGTNAARIILHTPCRVIYVAVIIGDVEEIETVDALIGTRLDAKLGEVVTEINTSSKFVEAQ